MYTWLRQLPGAAIGTSKRLFLLEALPYDDYCDDDNDNNDEDNNDNDDDDNNNNSNDCNDDVRRQPS